jgi:hypothetical protein
MQKRSAGQKITNSITHINKASVIAESVMQHEGEKMDKFLKHYAKEIESTWTISAGSCSSRCAAKCFKGKDVILGQPKFAVGYG